VIVVSAQVPKSSFDKISTVPVIQGMTLPVSFNAVGAHGCGSTQFTLPSPSQSLKGSRGSQSGPISIVTNAVSQDHVGT
jgi:hypothetical protein